MDDYQIETLLSHYAEEREKYSGAVNMPIFQNSLFVFPDWDSISKAFEDPVNSCIYTRGKNPSVHVTEKKIARLAFGEKAKLFSSGMGAISSAILHFIKSGDHVITIKNIYRPSNIFLNTYL